MRSWKILGCVLLLSSGFVAGWLASAFRSSPQTPEGSTRTEPTDTSAESRSGSSALTRGDGVALAPHKPNLASTDAKATDPLITPQIRGRVVDSLTGADVDPSVWESQLGARWEDMGPDSLHQALSLKIHPRGGWIAWEDTSFLATPFPSAETLAFIYPLHRAVPASLTVLDEAGRPLAGAEVKKAHLGAKSIFSGFFRPYAGTDDKGIYRFEGVPFVPGAEVTIDVEFVHERDDEEPGEAPMHRQVLQTRGTLMTRLPDAMPSELSWVLRLPPAAPSLNPEAGNEPGGSLIGIGGGEGRPVPTATIRARALRRDGSVAAGARLQFNGSTGSADSEGRAIFTWASERDADLTLALIDPALVPLARRVHVPSGATVDVELREPEAGQLHVTVLDPEGHAARFARLTVTCASGLGPWDLQGSTLRVDPFTDECGVRRYSRVGPDGVTVSASWLGNEGSESTTVEEGKEARVVIRLGRGRLDPWK